jgi:hypothetical protein
MSSWNEVPRKVMRPKKKVVGDNPLEAQEQVKLIVYLRKRNILHYAIPNGGKRGQMEAIRLKQQGVVAGVPDICIPVARKGHHGLYIELKRVAGGTVSDAQQYWMEALAKEGYKAEIVRGYDAAIAIVEEYFK